MSIDQTCNSSFWSREHDKIFENTLEIYFNDSNLFMKMEEALPGKSVDDIKDHYNILLEDIDAINSGRAPLPNSLEMQSTNKTLRVDVEWSFLQGLDTYGKGDRRSISRQCVITRTSMQVATHAQNVDAEFDGTSKVPTTEDMIESSCEGSQGVPNTSTENMRYRDRTNAEQMKAVVGGELSSENAFVNVRASSGTSGHSIPRIGSELEALLSHPMDEDKDINFIFDVGIAPTAQTRMSGYEAAEDTPGQLPPFAPSSYFGDGVWRSLDTRH
ncbi:hypothetical protein H5410_036453 [Solanum commersonii]|uniref:Myb-like domain-containing protein n=1 Tax=Solanum commersonii TaxID=4109 RepID=A0A9J5Y4U9_SOLCO|nr:hypothetical protein H5410_036453 [Solanum commersonii]